MMTISFNRDSLKSNFLASGVILICCGITNFIFVSPSLASKSEQLSSTEISAVRSKEEILLDALKKTPSEADISKEEISQEIHLVVKLKAKRVYVYQGNEVIKSYPIAIGKRGYETPQGTFKIFSREVNPVFKNFKTGQIISPGANNPLGPRWIGVWTDGKTEIGFHGTNSPSSIGKAVSHGCIRMYNKDVIALFEKVKIGTVVKVIP